MRQTCCAGAVLMVLAGSIPAVAQLPNEPTDLEKQAASVVPSYAAALHTLDRARPESIIEARDAAVARYAKAPRVEADAAFRLFWGFYRRVVSRLPYMALRSPEWNLLAASCGETLRCPGRRVDDFLRSTNPDDVRRRSENAAAVAAIARYRASGVAFDFGEGDWYACQDPDFVSGIAGRLPLGELAEWVAFWAAEEPQRLGEDASLLVGWDDLRQRLARWEAFGKRHPALPETQAEAAPHVRGLVTTYIFGVDNTGAYDRRFGTAPSWSPRIDPKLMASYGNFLRENRESSYYRVIEGIVDRVSRADGAPTADLVAFLTGELTDPWFKGWLPGTRRWFEAR